MNRKHVWLLMKEGFNVAEMSAALKVSADVAQACMAEAIPTTLPASRERLASGLLNWTAPASQTQPASSGMGSR